MLKPSKHSFKENGANDSMDDSQLDTNYDMDLAVSQFLFALINLRSLLRQGRVQDALEWLNGEYLTESALSEIDDVGLREAVLEELNRSNVQEKAQFI